tara:strand:- start:8387 stop:9094 length:708 start_codon:yes stop_codon:yes gene_type:complete
MAPLDQAQYSLAMLSIIIPTLNAAVALEQTLTALETSEIATQIIVSDGGSTDETQAIAKQLGAIVIDAPKGRGSQLAAGANLAAHPWLLFLHADTLLDKLWQKTIGEFITDPVMSPCAGVFKFTLDDPKPAARRLEKIVEWRCRLLGLPYGDQGLLISRQHYDQIGGFKGLPLFEDVDIVRRIGRRNIEYLEHAAITSAIRYQKTGYVLRSLKNATCLSLYFAGLPPKLIGRIYQ